MAFVPDRRETRLDLARLFAGRAGARWARRQHEQRTIDLYDPSGLIPQAQAPKAAAILDRSFEPSPAAVR